MSISINNFSIDVDSTLYCTSLIDFSVDITDSLYLITTEDTYFTDNGTRVSGTFTPITNGYRLSYTTLPSGNMTLVTFANNSNGEYLDRLYELQYGYEFIWENVNYWGQLKEVPIAISASNTALAANTSYFSTFFVTRKFENVDLEVSITAEGSGNMDLYTSIVPQSKYFINGRTYTVTISGIKDFSNNELATRSYSFTINDNII